MKYAPIAVLAFLLSAASALALATAANESVKPEESPT